MNEDKKVIITNNQDEFVSSALDSKFDIDDTEQDTSKYIGW